jgi:hypothetical protein
VTPRDRLRKFENSRPEGVERADPGVVRRGSEGSSDLVSFREVLVVGEISPAVLLPDQLEPGRHASRWRPTSTTVGLWSRFRSSACAASTMDFGSAAVPILAHDRIGGTPSCLAAQGRAAVVAAPGPAVDVGLAAEAPPASITQEALQVRTLTEWCGWEGTIPAGGGSIRQSREKAPVVRVERPYGHPRRNGRPTGEPGPPQRTS